MINMSHSDRVALSQGLSSEMPESYVSSTVAAAWCDILGVSPAGNDENFFAGGGDSVSAVELMERVESELGIEFPLQTLFLDGRFGQLVADCIERFDIVAAGD
jgi:acyl carrier protein